MVAEFSAALTDILRVEPCRVCDFFRRGVLSIREIFQNSIIRARSHPIGRSSHREKYHHEKKLVAFQSEKLFKNILNSSGLVFYSRNVWLERGTTHGKCRPRRIRDTDGLSSFQKRGPMLVTSARSGSGRLGAETMYDSTQRGKKGIDRKPTDALQDGECPNCGAGLMAVSSAGPGANRAQPCGCPIADFAMRELAHDGGSQ